MIAGLLAQEVAALVTADGGVEIIADPAVAENPEGIAPATAAIKPERGLFPWDDDLGRFFRHGIQDM
jgi:hypothetical protein